MNLAGFRTLLTPTGQEALQAAVALEPGEADFLRHFQYLSRIYPAGLARSALEIAVLRREATSKFFSIAEKLYFTRSALEQASPLEVSRYRAERFRPFRQLVDLGCSVGGDTFSLATLSPTVGIDLDLVRLAMAQANVQALKLGDQVDFVCADLGAGLPVRWIPGIALFFDPTRRADGERLFRVEAYRPPLSIVKTWLEDFPAIGVKISPGVKLGELRSYDAEVEFISLRGELKEATLWFGPLKMAYRRATVLPGPYTLTAEVRLDDLQKLPNPPLSPPLAYLYEPDPAVLRAGLVQSLAEQLDGAQLDSDIAYLTSDRLQPTPFARSWAVEGWFPFGLKRLRAYLRERGVGQVVVKKRGSPLQPQALIHDLRLKGEAERVVFLTHLRGQPITVVCFS